MLKDPKGRPPPSDVPLERQLLSCLICKPDAWEAVSEILSDEHLFGDGERALFAAIRQHADRGAPWPVWALERTLQREGKSGHWQAGAIELLTLQEAALAFPDRAALRLRDLARQRALNDAHWRALAEGYDSHEDVQTWIDECAARIEAIAVDVGPRASSSIGSSADAIMGGLDRIGGAVAKPMPTGIGIIDDHTGGLFADSAIFVGARPGVGKTALAVDTALSCAGTVDPDDGLIRAVFIVSAEMPRDQLTQRALCREARIDLMRFRAGSIFDDEWPRLRAAHSRVAALPIEIDDTKAPTPRHVRGRARALNAIWRRRQTKLALIVIDYVQLLDGRSLAGPLSKPHEQIDKSAEFIAGLPAALGVPVLALARMNRTENERPTAEDFYGSSGIESHAADIWILHRDDKHRRYDLDIPKARNGRRGRLFMSFDHGRFGPYDRQAKIPGGGGDEPAWF